MADSAIQGQLETQREARGVLMAGMSAVARERASADRTGQGEGRPPAQSIPDLLIAGLDGREGGGRDERVFDAKVLHLSARNYAAAMKPSPSRGAAVAARAREVPGHYAGAAREMDRYYSGTAAGEVGPVESRLAEYGGAVGLVFGAFGEASESVEVLLRQIGERLGHCHLVEMGERGVDNAAAVAQWQVRRAWAMTHWRESARLLRGNATHAAEGVHGGSLLSSGARSARDRALWGAAFRAHVRVGAQRPRVRRAVCAASFGRGRSVWGGSEASVAHLGDDADAGGVGVVAAGHRFIRDNDRV